MPQMQGSQIVRKITSVSTSTILKVVAVFLALYVLYIIRDVLLLLLISTILASALNPLVEWLHERIRFPRALTIILVYILFIGLLVLVISILVPTLISEFNSLGSTISDLRDRFQVQGSSIYELFNRFGLSSFLQSLSTNLSNLASGIFEKTIGLFNAVIDFITVLVVSFYLVSQQDALKDFFKTLTPPSYHPMIGSIVVKAQKKLGQWLLGQLALMASIFLMMYLALSLLGVKYALTLALFAGLMEIVPYIGPIISAIPGIFVGLLQSPILALILILVYWGIQQIENYLLVPKIIGKSIGANSLVVLIALLVGYNVAGIVGVLISAPVVAVGIVIIDEYTAYKKTAAEASKN